MGDEQDDLGSAMVKAWVAFRGRLADRLAALEDDEVLRIEVDGGIDEDELDGTAPYLQFVGWGEDLVRAEAVGNAFLDARFRLPEEAGTWFDVGGWHAPDDDEPLFHQDVERRDADRLAVTCVQLLREVYAVPHPAFLDAEGLEIEPASVADRAPSSTDGVDAEPEAVATVPEDDEHLQALVDAAMAVMLRQSMRHDDDGDIPVVAGRSALFVRLAGSRPAVDLYAEVVCDATDLDWLPIEVDLLNRESEFGTFHVRGSTVILEHRICALPFVPDHLRIVVATVMSTLDEKAAALASRVGGRRFFEEAAEAGGTAGPEGDDVDPAMAGLLELLHLGKVASASVGALFDLDRLRIIRQLVQVRTGRQDCDGHDAEVVLVHLRRGLRYVVDGEVPERRRRTVPPRPRTQQLPLISDEDAGEESLDLGWSA